MKKCIFIVTALTCGTLVQGSEATPEATRIVRKSPSPKNLKTTPRSGDETPEIPRLDLGRVGVLNQQNQWGPQTCDPQQLIAHLTGQLDQRIKELNTIKAEYAQHLTAMRADAAEAHQNLERERNGWIKFLKNTGWFTSGALTGSLVTTTGLVLYAFKNNLINWAPKVQLTLPSVNITPPTN